MTDRIMPMPEAMITLSWEDIETKAESMKVKLTEQEVADLFDEIIRLAGKSERLYETFWHLVEYAIEERNKE